MKIYTKGGDKGQTSLVNSVKVAKSDLRLSVYGTSDELNSWLGFALSELSKEGYDQKTREPLIAVQKYLFQFGSLLACEKKDWGRYGLKAIGEGEIEKIESEIDFCQGQNGELNNFILPGGCEASSRLHVCRSVCRRLERLLIEFYSASPDEEDMNLIKFVNRLSDYFFVCARLINKVQGIKEVIWP